MRTALALALMGLLVLAALPTPSLTEATEDDTALNDGDAATPEADLADHKSSGTATERVVRLDGLSAEEAKLLKDKAEKHEFQAEVNRMMKLIINSLYKNKDIFLRELISNASDALDKIRLIALTDKGALGDVEELSIKIHVDKENKVLHITDTGIGMTREDLVKNLGTIAKSGTSEFLSKVQEGATDTSSLIGQFGVGFYSAFLVADEVIVTSKHNDDKQYIWRSDANSFSVVEDPREDEQLGRGTRISLVLKEEAEDFLEENRIRELVKKYSEFINFDIYLYTSKDVPIDPEELEKEIEAEEAEIGEDDEEEEASDEDEIEDEDDAAVEDEEPESEEEVKTTKTVWDWEVINANKPIWTRNAKEVEAEEYTKFYQAFTKNEDKEPIGHVHFTAEGEVTFRSILYIPPEAPNGFYSDYGKQKQNIKMYVRRVFITDEFDDMMPKYLGFLQGVVDSDDLPLNVSRETLQQHKLLKVIKKRLVRKALDMIKKLEPDAFKTFWKEYGTSIKLGLIEDYSNRNKLSKLLRFQSSNDAEELTSLEAYVERMKDSQKAIFFIAGSSRKEVESSPFVERLLKRGYEVLYLTEPVDEYTIQNLPEFDGKKFQNVAKEGLELDDSEEAKEYHEQAVKDYEPLTKWLGTTLSEAIDKAVVSSRLTESPCALVASQYGWSGNMERIMRAQAYAKSDDVSSNFYATQKKTLEINPRHPLIKALNERVKAQAEAEEEGAEGEEVEGTTEDATLVDTAKVLLDTARLRSGYTLADSVSFAQRIERMLRINAGVDLDAEVEPEPEIEEESEGDDDEAEEIDEEEEEEEGDDVLEGDDGEPAAKDEL